MREPNPLLHTQRKLNSEDIDHISLASHKTLNNADINYCRC